MDCNSLIALIESKYSKTISPFGKEEDLSETEMKRYLDSTAEFLRWMEDTILKTPVDKGESSISARQCILDTLGDDPDEAHYPHLWASLALFSDMRLKQIFGVEIFSDDEDND
jgi:hypothetical protein